MYNIESQLLVQNGDITIVLNKAILDGNSDIIK